MLDDVSLTARAGEIVALLGPSGCGKTTLLRVIAGLQPHAGDVRWQGRSLAAVPAHRRGFGLVFQDQALFPHLDVERNVAFGLRMQVRTQRGSAANHGRRVTELLELVGLSGLSRRPVDSLSGGEAQRVALARALAPHPRLLMLDEPLAGLDRPLRDQLLVDLPRILRRLRQTALFVTHDLEEALAVSDRVAVMRAGPHRAGRHPACPLRAPGQRVRGALSSAAPTSCTAWYVPPARYAPARKPTPALRSAPARPLQAPSTAAPTGG